MIRTVIWNLWKIIVSDVKVLSILHLLDIKESEVWWSIISRLFWANVVIYGHPFSRPPCHIILDGFFRWELKFDGIRVANDTGFQVSTFRYSLLLILQADFNTNKKAKQCLGMPRKCKINFMAVAWDVIKWRLQLLFTDWSIVWPIISASSSTKFFSGQPHHNSVV